MCKKFTLNVKTCRILDQDSGTFPIDFLTPVWLSNMVLNEGFWELFAGFGLLDKECNYLTMFSVPFHV